MLLVSSCLAARGQDDGRAQPRAWCSRRTASARCSSTPTSASRACTRSSGRPRASASRTSSPGARRLEEAIHPDGPREPLGPPARRDPAEPRGAPRPPRDGGALRAAAPRLRPHRRRHAAARRRHGRRRSSRASPTSCCSSSPSGKTKKRAAEHGAHVLRSVGVEPAGVVLNQVRRGSRCLRRALARRPPRLLRRGRGPGDGAARARSRLAGASPAARVLALVVPLAVAVRPRRLRLSLEAAAGVATPPRSLAAAASAAPLDAYAQREAARVQGGVRRGPPPGPRVPRGGALRAAQGPESRCASWPRTLRRGGRLGAAPAEVFVRAVARRDGRHGLALVDRGRAARGGAGAARRSPRSPRRARSGWRPRREGRRRAEERARARRSVDEAARAALETVVRVATRSRRTRAARGWSTSARRRRAALLADLPRAPVSDALPLATARRRAARAGGVRRGARASSASRRRAAAPGPAARARRGAPPPRRARRGPRRSSRRSRFPAASRGCRRPRRPSCASRRPRRRCSCSPGRRAIARLLAPAAAARARGEPRHGGRVARPSHDAGRHGARGARSSSRSRLSRAPLRGTGRGGGRVALARVPGARGVGARRRRAAPRATTARTTALLGGESVGNALNAWGTFVNRAHFAGFAVVLLGAALASRARAAAVRSTGRSALATLGARRGRGLRLGLARAGCSASRSRRAAAPSSRYPRARAGARSLRRLVVGRRAAGAARRRPRLRRGRSRSCGRSPPKPGRDEAPRHLARQRSASRASSRSSASGVDAFGGAYAGAGAPDRRPLGRRPPRTTCSRSLAEGGVVGCLAAARAAALVVACALGRCGGPPRRRGAASSALGACAALVAVAPVALTSAPFHAPAVAARPSLRGPSCAGCWRAARRARGRRTRLSSGRRTEARRHGAGRGHRRRGLHRVATSSHALPRRAATRVVAVDNLLTGSLDNLARLPRAAGLRVRPRATSARASSSRARWTRSSTSRAPRRPRDYLEFPIQTLKVGRARHAQRARARAGEGREVPPREHERGLRRPRGPPAARDLPRARELRRAPRRLRRGQALRRGDDDGLPPRARHRHADRAHLQHVRPAHARCDDGRALPEFLAQALRGEPLTVHGDGPQTRSFCYVDDTVAGILTVLDKAGADPVNVGAPGEITILEMREAILVAPTGSRSRRPRRTRWSTTRAAASPT